MLDMLDTVREILQKYNTRYVAPITKTKDGVDPQVVSYSDRLSSVSEQYRAVCCKLINNPSDKIITITSSQPQEGKTTTSCNLAATFSSSLSLKTLLIDADLRRPRVHDLLGIDREPGLSDIVNGKIEAKELIKSPSVRGLYVIPAGKPTSSPEVLLNSDKFKNLLKELRAQFDRIIIDTPPVLKTADVQAVGPFSDSILFVVQSGVTPKHMVEEAFSILKNTKTSPTACILTNTERMPNYYSLITKPVYRDHYLNKSYYSDSPKSEKED